MDWIECPARLEMLCCVESWMMHELWKAPCSDVRSRNIQGPMLGHSQCEKKRVFQCYKNAIPAGNNFTAFLSHYRVVEQGLMQSHHNGYRKVSSIQCVTLAVILVTLHGSAKKNVTKQRLSKFKWENLPQNCLLG